MDGVAVDSQTVGAGTRSFRVQATQAAGDPPLTLAAAADCIEVMTGAVLPVGCNSVIPVEELTLARAGGWALAPGRACRTLAARSPARQRHAPGDAAPVVGRAAGAPPEIAIAASAGNGTHPREQSADARRHLYR